MITELKYTTTNTYLIDGEHGTLLLDTGWAGTFPAFCKEMGEKGRKLQEIDYILVTHYHPDHMGIAGEIAEHGPVIVTVDLQLPYLHGADEVLVRSGRGTFLPIVDEKVRVITLEESRGFLRELGLQGEILHTPGHSEDSISLWLDEGALFVGDLNPLYELELHAGTEIGESWKRLLELQPKRVYYGHAKTAVLEGADGEMARKVEREEAAGDEAVRAEGHEDAEGPAHEAGTGSTAAVGSDMTMSHADLYALISQIMKYIDKGMSMEKIRKKTGADATLVEDVNRMYLTHRNVGVQGILDRIEIKGR